nr:hypothetical protein CFP56_31323 [Quercus suber]
MSIEALAMAGIDCIKCTINLEEVEHRDVEKTPQYLLAEQKPSTESETNEDQVDSETVAGLDYFLIRFKLNEDYWKVLNEGPWFIGQQFLSVKQWSPRFKPSEAKLTTTAIWAKLLKLPVELYDGSILRRIGNQIGNLLKIDARTVDNIRGRFCQTLHSSRLGLSPHLQSSHRLSGATRLI